MSLFPFGWWLGPGNGLEGERRGEEVIFFYLIFNFGILITLLSPFHLQILKSQIKNIKVKSQGRGT